MSLLEIDKLHVSYPVEQGLFAKRDLHAVAGVSLSIAKGESVGLVGESGCGKSTLGKAIMRMVDVRSGTCRYDGRDVLSLRGDALREYRHQVQMIFQDPFGSLNERMTVGDAIREVLWVHRVVGRDDLDGRVADLLTAVGLDPRYMNRYPHEFSGGQRQRIGIARALAQNPSLIIADEPVSALDVSVQVQILNLMKELQLERGLSYLFVAHDLAVVRYVCDRILVMYLGEIVEEADAEELFRNPRHPYTKALISAVPDVAKGLASRESGSARDVLEGDLPSPLDRPSGCVFHPRCRYAKEACREGAPPEAVDFGEGHYSRCHFAKDGFETAGPVS